MERRAIKESPMQDGVDFRQFMYKVSEASQPDEKNWLRFRETLATAILGTLSNFAVVVVLIIFLRTGVNWNQPLERLVPSSVAISGELLGVSGVSLGRWRGGTVSPLSAAGTIASLIAMSLIAIAITVAN
jgi:ABC-type Fe3+ transport system permease subunit